MRRSAASTSGECPFLSAVRSAERWARLRAIAARDLRMFFLADAILGNSISLDGVGGARINGRVMEQSIKLSGQGRRVNLATAG